MSRRIKMPIWILIFPCLLVLISGCRKEIESVPDAPDFTLSNISGQTESLSEYRGSIVLLDFWATWCPPCRMSIPELIGFQKKYRDKGLVVLGISMDDPQQVTNKDLESFKKMAKINYTILRYNRKVVADYFVNETPAVPTMFLIDRKGKIRDKIVGFVPGALEKALKGFLK